MPRHEFGTRILLRAFGAEIVLTLVLRDERRDRKGESYCDDANGYILQQFANPRKPRIHLQTTGPEIWNDTDGRWTS